MNTGEKCYFFSENHKSALLYIYDESLITVFSIYNWQCQPWGTLCHILFKSKRKTYFAKLFFQERKIPVNNLQSFIVDFPEPWCVIYEVFLILWRHTHYHCFVDFFKTFTFLARSMYCIFKDLTFSPWYYVKRLPLPPCPPSKTSSCVRIVLLLASQLCASGASKGELF